MPRLCLSLHFSPHHPLSLLPSLEFCLPLIPSSFAPPSPLCLGRIRGFLVPLRNTEPRPLVGQRHRSHTDPCLHASANTIATFGGNVLQRASGISHLVLGLACLTCKASCLDRPSLPSQLADRSKMSAPGRGGGEQADVRRRVRLLTRLALSGLMARPGNP